MFRKIITIFMIISGLFLVYEGATSGKYLPAALILAGMSWILFSTEMIRARRRQNA